ncbi:MAG: hypothetical protein AABX44_01140 [Nanoarchaeota archaeon]
MNLKNEINKSWKTIFKILSRKKYFLIALGTAIIIFSLLYYFMVATVAKNSLKTALMMSGVNYIYATFLLILILSLLFGIYFSMVIFKFSLSMSMGKQGFAGIIGSLVGAFGVGCPTCGAFLFASIGAPLALMYLPFKGIELQILGVIILLLSIYLIGKSIYSNCDIKKRN